MDDYWTESWLKVNYGGAPDECSICYREGYLVKISECAAHD